jgi:hypothetical protein
VRRARERKGADTDDDDRGYYVTGARTRRLSQLVESVSKKTIPAHQRDITFEMMVDDENGEDLEVPYLKVRVR